MVRKTSKPKTSSSSGRGTSPSGSSTANAFISPIQLRDTAPADPLDTKNLVVVQLDQLDFQETGYYFNFDAVLNRCISPSFLEIQASSNDKGKRKATVQDTRHNAKKTRLQLVQDDVQSVILVDSACVFKVDAENKYDKNRAEQLLGHLKRLVSETNLCCGPVSLSTTPVSASSQDFPTLFGHTATLRHVDTNEILATFPLIHSKHFPPSSRPDQFTNGEWIHHAVHLHKAQLAQMQASLSIVEPPEGLLPHEKCRHSVFVRLAIQVQVRISSDVQASSHHQVMADWAELVRFADGYSSQEEEEQRRSQVSASFVYENLRPASLSALDHVQPWELHPILLPFQKRSVTFLLAREGKTINSQGQLVPSSEPVMAHDGPTQVGLWWKQIRPQLYYNFLECRFALDPLLTQHSDIQGAMLSEEMGLGKTVEVIALILLHPDPTADQRQSWFDAVNEVEVHPTKTTLIIAPETLRKQWIEEIRLHAPSLQIYSYTGQKQAERDVAVGINWVSFARRFDVIITSYAVLSHELKLFSTEPQRSRRFERRYERLRSPLIHLHFHRVIMDEVQLVGNGNAAESASMISRTYSLAVSGTPVKKMDDLRSCFRFLKLPGHQLSANAWVRTFSSNLLPILVRTLRTIATRNTKVQVASEMSLPVQTRSVVPVDFTAIEATFYNDVWKDALEAIRLDADGKPTSPVWELDVQKMRSHLLLLRQACTHPQVAVHARGGMVASQNLQNIDKVLEIMIDATKGDRYSVRGSLFDHTTSKAILWLYLKDEDQRILAAAQLHDLANDIRHEIQHIEKEYASFRKQGPLYQFTHEEIELEGREDARIKARESSVGLDSRYGEPSLDISLAWKKLQADPMYQEKRRQRSVQLTTLKNLLRNMLIRLHRVYQFTGNTYFQRGEYFDENHAVATAVVTGGTATTKKDYDIVDQDSAIEIKALNVVGFDAVINKEERTIEPTEEANGFTSEETIGSAELKGLSLREKLKQKEDEAYSQAEKVRQELVADAREEVERAIHRLNRTKVTFTEQDLHCESRIFRNGGGRLTYDAYATLDANCHLLNNHAKVMFSWRQAIVSRLTRAVNRDINREQEDDDQYQENLDTQAEAEVLLEMFRPLVAEREKILTGAVAVGSTDMPPIFNELKSAVDAKRYERSVLHSQDQVPRNNDVYEVQQQQLDHFLRLKQEMDEVCLHRAELSFYMVSARLRDSAAKTLSEEEIAFMKRGIAESKRIVAEQTKWLTKIQAEQQGLLATVFNARTRYFKEIQALSDSVRDPVFHNLDQSIQSTILAEARSRDKLERLESRLRYFFNLQKMQKADEAKCCFICTDLIDVGILTNACGHVCCESCFKVWQSQGHRTCPMCKTRVLASEAHRIVYRKPAESVQPGSEPWEPAPNGETLFRYHAMAEPLGARIEATACQGRFGSKIDTVIKHIKYIIETTGEKSLVFSSFGRGLDVVAQSLKANGIRFIRFTSGGKLGGQAAEQFRSTDIPVMLLHSEVQSAGLNLLSATHVHLLEPLLNRSLELQAIGRVHRIGQTKETMVWCYYVRDTVEERILHLAAQQGQSLYLNGKHTSLLNDAKYFIASANGTDPDLLSAASMSKLDAQNWGKESAPKHSMAGSSDSLRGDFTTSNEDLLRCYFFRKGATVQERLGGNGGSSQTRSPSADPGHHLSSANTLTEGEAIAKGRWMRSS